MQIDNILLSKEKQSQCWLLCQPIELIQQRFGEETAALDVVENVFCNGLVTIPASKLQEIARRTRFGFNDSIIAQTTSTNIFIWKV